MNNTMVPKAMFFTRGVGKHQHSLQSFEAALRHAGIAQLNLVRVSSIFPPKCKIISRTKGLSMVEPGSIIYCVIAECRTNEPNRLEAAGVGLAVPADRDSYGYISEHHGFGMNRTKCEDYVEDMAATMLATTHGIELDPEKAYDERLEIYKSKKLVVTCRSAVQTAEGDKNGLWTTVMAAAVFIL